MLKYLKSIHSIQPQLVVVGNQAADLDSCCSALVASYLEHHVFNTLSIPLIDIPRDELKLRKDVEYLLKANKIDLNDLYFADEIKTSNVDLFLVDHNAKTIDGNVVKIIDHHAVENTNFDLSKINSKIVKCGSCMSAVVNYYTKFTQTQNLFENDHLLVNLALAPILQDTSNMTKKVEQEDLQAFDFLRQFNASVDINLMSKLKSDLNGFSFLDILKKDYKQWGNLGIASVPKLLSKLDFDAIAKEMHVLKKDNKLNLLVVLGSGKRGGVYTREFAYLGDLSLPKLSELKLEFIREVDGVKLFNQMNVDASRKQVAPMVRASE